MAKSHCMDYEQKDVAHQETSRCNIGEVCINLLRGMIITFKSEMTNRQDRTGQDRTGMILLKWSNLKRFNLCQFTACA